MLSLCMKMLGRFLSLVTRLVDHCFVPSTDCTGSGCTERCQQVSPNSKNMVQTQIILEHNSNSKHGMIYTLIWLYSLYYLHYLYYNISDSICVKMVGVHWLKNKPLSYWHVTSLHEKQLIKKLVEKTHIIFYNDLQYLTLQNQNSIWLIQVEKVMHVCATLMSLLPICYTRTKDITPTVQWCHSLSVFW